MRTLVLIVALLTFSHAARADWSLEFVRITCIPEARYFYFEYKPVSGPAALTDTQFDEKMQRERMRIWQRHGFFDPRSLERECRLPESTYKLITSQPPAREQGMCGGAPQITLNLFRNGTAFFKDVVFGDDCFGGPSVVSVEITDGLEGWDTRQMTVCISPAVGEARMCKFLSETYGDIAKAVPVTGEVINRYVKER
jgi:hypothetical protein